ncbi:MAG: hypothetical protein E7392_03990 [Ruminococcaceae bacterium]|nr:hypothetical protein [Oscillospiraceae bacterium]
MISVGENKSVLCKGDFRPAELYKGDKKVVGYERVSIETADNISITDCYNDKLHDVIIEGNTIQDGTPTPQAPVEIQNVGELMTEGENKGKYKVSLRCKYGDSTFLDENNIEIYLDEPLMKMTHGNKTCADYIDFEKSVVVKYNFKEIYDGTESWEIVSTSNPNTFSKRITTARTVICSHYQTGYTVGIDMTAAANYSVRVYITDSRFSTVEDFKAFLAQQSEAGTPVTVVILNYSAYNGSPREEPIELPEIPTKYGCTNIYELANAVKPKLRAKYKKIIKEG